MCAHMWKLNVFFATAAAAPARKKLFHLFFSDNKKAVLHSTFYPFSYNITWQKLTGEQQQDAESGANSAQG